MSLPNPPPPFRKKRLGEILLDAALLSETQLRTALAEQRKWGGKLGHTLVQMGFVDENSMVHALSRQLQIPTVDLSQVAPPAHVFQLFPAALAERYSVFPVAVDLSHKALTLASADPTNVEALNELAFHTGHRIQVVVSSASAIERAIRQHYYGGTGTTTAHPGEFGLDEPFYEFTPPSSPVTRSPREAELVQRVDALTQQVADLERMVANQARSLSTLIEVLESQGALSRQEYFARMRGPSRS
ncbi:general secretion pathway protein GspE [Stigmatella sp. ncwal1]|uniref:General secretion pathway protein GspE n=1 Tax=Stigmatella ashevillensis TaxID=2995309 RepID=A0ABT5D265_9BACT|nr:general secretion pathway protein GspE [Stigmatella ashevillena]MDC0707646.1 general secretion pathway protein GspE [Stigmatella ashevillena]